MQKVWYRFPLAAAVFILWYLLLNPLDIEKVIIGSVITLLVIITPFPQISTYGEFSLVPKKVLFGIAFFLIFIIAVMKSNLDVAKRVISPKLPINPGVVEVKTKLKSRIGRLFLANAITLTPGTITVDIVDDSLFIHWIFIDSEDQEVATKKIVEDFEKYLEVIFG